eukprot:evm.model.scf_1336.3 EVM.evm.TU.scf_1336.3   scf_1336:34906-43561(-)
MASGSMLASLREEGAENGVAGIGGSAGGGASASVPEASTLGWGGLARRGPASACLPFDADRVYFTNLANQKLAGDAGLAWLLPLNPATDDLVASSRDGALPCRLLARMVPDAIDERAVNLAPAGAKLDGRRAAENLALCLSSAEAIGGAVGRVEPAELMAADSCAIMALLWIIIRAGLLRPLDMRVTPELAALHRGDEEPIDLAQLPAEELLRRWACFSLEQEHAKLGRGSKGVVPTVANFGESLQDCRAYILLLHRVAPHLCDPALLNSATLLERSRIVIECCRRLGIGKCHSAEMLRSGSERVGMALLAEIFALHHGLTIKDSVKAVVVEGDEEWDEGTREERVFRMWMNNLGCPSICDNLFSEDMRCGWLLLEVLDSMVPGAVDWSQAFQPPFKDVVHRIKSASNCNQVVRIACEKLSLSLVGIGGEDIADGKEKPILALVWQLMRWHTLQVVRSAACGAAGTAANAAEGLNETDVLAWANRVLALGSSPHQISSFRDRRLATGLPLLGLLMSIEPGCVQEQHIKPGKSRDECKLNAKYVISTARKLGATVLMGWEDIVEVRPKMTLVLIASLMELDERRKQHCQTATTESDRLTEAVAINAAEEGAGVLTYLLRLMGCDHSWVGCRTMEIG